MNRIDKEMMQKYCYRATTDIEFVDAANEFGIDFSIGAFEEITECSPEKLKKIDLFLLGYVFLRSVQDNRGENIDLLVNIADEYGLKEFAVFDFIDKMELEIGNLESNLELCNL